MPYTFFKLAFVMSLMSMVGFAQSYSAGTIPDNLKENAHSVIREYTRELEIKTCNNGKEKVKKAITVLDANGCDAAQLRIFYDKNSQVTIKEVNLFDGFGNRIKKIKASEITDFPSYDGASIYSDNRVMHYKPVYPEFPYTLEYVYEINHSNLVSYACWFPLSGYEISLEHCKFTLVVPSEIGFKKKEFFLQEKSFVSTKAGKAIESWEFHNLAAIEEEPMEVDLLERVPKIYLMPVQVLYDKHVGTVTDWSEFGTWVYNLFEGRDELAAGEKVKINDLLKDIQDTVQKVKLLYAYMQGRTRYVGIQLGIGGFQPFSAQSVFETGYGDCKALSNYMHALLKFSGIPSFSVLVAAGKYIEPVQADFPNFMQFNHVILCVPTKKDTIWLECTSQNIPFGFLGNFTDDRDVLLLSKNGGKWAHTKKYTAEENLKSTKAEFLIDSLGTLKGALMAHYSGLQYDEIDAVLNTDYDKQKKWLYKTSSFPSLEIHNFKMENKKMALPNAFVKQSISSKNYCSLSGSFMVLPLNLVSHQRPVQKILKARKTDFLLPRSLIECDTLVYKIPANYKVESIPEGSILNSNYGNYSFSIRQHGNTITYIRKYEVKQGRYKASEYKDYHAFCGAVAKSDNMKVLLAKF